MNTEQNIRVLVLDADMVPALTIARSLSRCGCLIDLASHTSNPLSSHSNCIDQVYLYPDPLSAEEDFLEWLLGYTQAIQFDLVIPVTERSLVPISNNRDMFEHVTIAMPAAGSLEVALDKVQTMELAEKVGVPVPGGVSIESMEDLERQFEKLKYPVVLKPARSLGTNEGSSSQLKVSYAFDEVELRSGCEHGLKYGPILLQEYFRGQGVGIELIAHNGVVVYAFQHLRLHEVPLSGGGSSLRISVPIEPKLLEASERLMSALNWNGVAMVEFKWNPETEDFTLMEINGRFWGSLPLPDAAGADFPAMLLELMLHDKITPSEPYREGIVCRKFSSDLYWYEAVVRRGPESRIADIPDTWTIFKELALFLSPRHRMDVQSFRDPVPGLVDFADIIANYYNRFVTLLTEKWFLRQQASEWRSGEVAKSIEGSKNLLFICYGNINRSALAGELISGAAEDSAVSVVSAGFHHESGRPADPVMVEVARDHGVDLLGSRSTELTCELIDQSDVIFVMEKVHFDRLQAMREDAAGKTYLLGAHEGRVNSGPEIQDPFGHSRDKYEHCFRRINEAVGHIKGALAQKQVRAE